MRRVDAGLIALCLLSTAACVDPNTLGGFECHEEEDCLGVRWCCGECSPRCALPADGGADGAGDAGGLSGPDLLEAGACAEYSVAEPGPEREVAVSLGSPRLTAHVDPGCSQPLATLRLSPTPTRFYVANHSSPAERVELRVGGHLKRVTALPLVRRGRCDFPAGDLEVTCAVTPPIPDGDPSRTLLVTHSLTASDSPAALAACGLRVEGGAVVVRCVREAVGPSTSVEWQTASHARAAVNGGWSVTHASGVMGAALGLPAVVDPGAAFFLVSHTATGSSWSSAQEAGFELRADRVVVHAAPGLALEARRLEVQVVTWGAPVRHVAFAASPWEARCPTAGPCLGLITAAGAGTAGCAGLATGVQANGWRWSTGLGGACPQPASQPHAQVVALPPRAVLTVPNVGLGAGVADTSVALQGLAPHRALVFLSHQGLGGQGRGVATTASSLSSLFTTLTVTEPGLLVRRGSATGGVDLLASVVTFEP